MVQKDYKVVNNKETLVGLVEKLKSAEYVAFDVEATGANIRKDAIVGASFCFSPGDSYYLPTFEWSVDEGRLVKLYIEERESFELLKKTLTLCTNLPLKLIMHNASYDTGIVFNQYGINLLPLLYCDTILLVHTVFEEGAFGFGSPFSLKSIGKMVQSEIGLDVEKEANIEQIEVKESVIKNGGKLTKKEYELYKADLDILAKYGNADTDLTFRIFNYFSKKLEEENLVDFFYNVEVMPLYKEVTIPMEWEGVALDIESLEKDRLDIEVDLQNLKEEILKKLLEEISFKRYVLDSAINKFNPFNHKDEEYVPVSGHFAQRLVELFKVNLPYDSDKGKYKVLKSEILKLEDSWIKEFLLKTPVEDPNNFEGIKDLYKVSISLWKDFNGGDYISITSKKQLKDFIFGFLKEEPLSYTDKGSPQFNDEYISHIKDKYSWAESLHIFNKLSKIKSSYIDRFLENHENGRYYFYFNQHGTVSGRYSSDAQQLPRPFESPEGIDSRIYKYTNNIRAYLISDENTVFIDNDYVSLEPTCFAHVSSDKGLQEIFWKDLDFYSTIAIKTEKLEGVSADKKADNFLKKVDPSKRQSAKAYCLGIPYGLSAYALGKQLNKPTNEAQELVDGYLNAFPNLKKWMEDTDIFVKENGYIKSLSGRVRHLPKVKALYEKFKDGLLDYDIRTDLVKTYGEDLVLSWYRDYKNGLNNGKNFQIQSLASSVVNRAAIKANRLLRERDWGLCVAQIHDQLIFKVKEEVKKEAASLIKDVMENIITLDVPLLAPPEISKNWRDGH